MKKLIQCGIYETDHGSDHKAIKAAFSGEIPNTTLTTPKFILAKADWVKINRDIGRRLPPVPDQCQSDTDFDTQVATFTEIISTAVRTYTPRAKPSPYAKRWWTEDLTILRRTYSSIRNSVTTARRRGQDTTEIVSQVLRARRLFFSEMEKQKKLHWREFLHDPANI